MPKDTNAVRWAEIRQAFRALRRASGATQEEIAARVSDVPALGKRHSWLSRLESGRITPHVDTAIGWARALGKDFVVVDRRVAPIAELDAGEVTLLVRGARAALAGKTLDPLSGYRLGVVLAKLSPVDRA